MRSIQTLLVPFAIPAILLVMALSCKKSTGDKPIAKFSVTKACDGTGPCKVQFNNLSTNALTYSWSFGDDSTSIQKSPSHTYFGASFYLVTLNAVGKEDEAYFTDTVYLTDHPGCNVVGTLTCAKKVTMGLPLSDQMSPNQSLNYYYFTPAITAPVKISLKPVPSGGSLRVQVLSDATSSAQSIGYKDGNPGEEILFYCGPLQPRTYYLKVQQYGTTGTTQAYNLACYSVTGDANEDNGTFQQSTLLKPGPQSVQGTILPDGDQDYFKFYQSKPGVMNILLTPVPLFSTQYSQLYLEVYTQASTTSQVKIAYAKPGEDIRVAVGPLDTGTHYIHLYGTYDAQSTDPYNLLVQADTSDNWEINNTFSASPTISLGQDVRATIQSTTDVDFFSFTASSSAPLKINIANVPGDLPYLYVELYSDANTSALVYRTYAYSNSPLNGTSPNLVAGKKYYIKVYSSGAAGSATQYHLKITN